MRGIILKSILLFTIFCFLITKYQAQYQKSTPLKSKETYKLEGYVLGDSDKKIINQWLSGSIPDTIDPYVASRYGDILKKKHNVIVKKIIYLEKDESLDEPRVNEINDSLRFLRKEKKELFKYFNFFYSINRFTGTPIIQASIFPLRLNPIYADFYYGNILGKDFQYLQNFVIQGSEEKSIVASDLITGYFGVLRVNLSTVIYNNDDTNKVETQVDKLYNGGGLIGVNINYPLFYSRYKIAVLLCDFNLRGSADFNVFGNEIPKDDFIGYVEPSINIFTEIMFSEKENVRIFGGYKGSAIYATDKLNESLGRTHKNEFGLHQISIGINFSNRFKISSNIPLERISGLGGADNFTVGIQFFPK